MSGPMTVNDLEKLRDAGGIKGKIIWLEGPDGHDYLVPFSDRNGPGRPVHSAGCRWCGKYHGTYPPTPPNASKNWKED